MIITLLIVHGLLAVALLGAVTHQTAALWWPPRRGAHGFVDRFRGRQAVVFTNAIVVLYVLTFVLGAVIYPAYRVDVRLVLEDMLMYAPTGAFEIKEHIAALGLGLLPAYWHYARKPAGEFLWTRRLHAAFLALGVWFGFITGHVLNNLRGMGA
ncbi:MAG: hypothetical protein IT493_08905 [Gammaproteobacteria bacterium]|nr:hypothetical protein [Gammaproteobacteria bacterium]